MLVKELIEKLKELPQDLKVFYVGEYCAGEISVIDTQPTHSDFDPNGDSIVLTDDQ